MIEGTITATLLNRLNPGAIDARKEAAGRLYNVSEFAAEVAAAVVDPIPADHTRLVGDVVELHAGRIRDREAADLDLLTGVSTPTVHPGGGRAVVSVTHPVARGRRDRRSAVDHPARPGTPRPKRLTRGFRDTAPQFSPDGRLIAFLRAEPKRPPQLYVVDAAGGEPVAVTDRTLGVTEFAWSPDGRTLAFVSREPEQGRYGTVEGIDPNAEPAAPHRHAEISGERARLHHRPPRARLRRRRFPTSGASRRPAGAAAGRHDRRRAGGRRAAAADRRGRGTTARSRSRPTARASPSSRRGTPAATTTCARTCSLLPLEGGDAQRPDRGARLLQRRRRAVRELNGVLFFTAQDVGESGRDFVGRNTALYVIDADGAAPRLLTDPETVDLTESDIVGLPRRRGAGARPAAAARWCSPR